MPIASLLNKEIARWVDCVDEHLQDAHASLRVILLLFSENFSATDHAIKQQLSY